MRETEIGMHIRESEREIVEWRKMHVKETKTGVKDSVRVSYWIAGDVIHVADAVLAPRLVDSCEMGKGVDLGRLFAGFRDTLSASSIRPLQCPLLTSPCLRQHASGTGTLPSIA